MALHTRYYIDPSRPDPNGPHDAPAIIYGYVPSLALIITAIILFTIALLMHITQLVRHKRWSFSPFAVGILFEIIGYAFRLLSNLQDPYSIPWFVVQYVFIVVAPVLLSAAIYTVLSSLTRVLGREYAVLSPKMTLWLFVACDVVATLVQIIGAGGVGLAEAKGKSPVTSVHVLLAGLAFQVLSFTGFLLVLGVTLVRSRRTPRSVRRSFLAAFVVASLAVYLRCVFRVVETALGLDNKLSTDETFFGCLDFAPIVLAVFILAYWHPGRFLDASPLKTEGEVVASRANEAIGLVKIR